MPKYELKYNNQVYEVEAPDEQSAVNALGKANSNTLQNRERKVDSLITERGQISPREIGSKLTGPGVVSKGIGALQAVAAPQQAYEAAVANPLLELQAGRPSQMPAAFMQGIKGERLGEFGDLGRVAGYPEPVNVAMGTLVGMVAPLSLMSKGVKSLRGLTKYSDKGIRTAGESLLRGADNAVKNVGDDLNKIYSGVNKIKGKSEKFLDVISETPDILIKHIEKEFGKSIEDITSNVDIETVRRVKGLIGKLKSSSFGRGDRGLVETLEADKVKKVYGGLKNFIQDTLTDNNFGDVGKELLDADEAFEGASNAARYIRKTVTDSTLRKPTHGGKVARGLAQGGDTTTREALTTLRASGKTAKKEIDTAIRKLNNYNRLHATSMFAKGALKTAFYAGIVGSIGAKTARAVLGDK